MAGTIGELPNRVKSAKFRMDSVTAIMGVAEPLLFLNS